MKLFFTILLYFHLLTLCYAGQSNFPNPHWDRNLCLECHTKSAKGDIGSELKFGRDFISLCNRCHETISRDKYIHAVAMSVPEDQFDRMPDDFKKAVHKDKNGKLTCVVCHELKYQCLSTEYFRKESNPRFFRGGPYAQRSDICYHCHDRFQYERLNPHDQITDEGDLIADRCVYCHDETPDRRKVRNIKDVSFIVKEEFERLCTRCHMSDKARDGCITLPDGSKLNHMRKPSEGLQTQISSENKDYITPQEPPTGRIFCGTCHNPHEIGVQRLSKADKGADAFKKLRSGIKERCSGCHGDNFNPVAPILPAQHPK